MGVDDGVEFVITITPFGLRPAGLKFPHSARGRILPSSVYTAYGLGRRENATTKDLTNHSSTPTSEVSSHMRGTVPSISVCQISWKGSQATSAEIQGSIIDKHSFLAGWDCLLSSTDRGSPSTVDRSSTP
jgi:hypothetical protein